MTTIHTRSTTRWRYRIFAVLTLTAFGALGLVGTANAHTDLTSSDPAEGSTLTAAPASIALTFNEPVQDFEPVVALTGPDGQPYPTSPPVVDSTVVRSDVGGLGPAGTYTIAYRVVSVDGHPVTGEVRFEFAPAAPPVTAEPPVAAPLAASPVAASPVAASPVAAPPAAATSIESTSAVPPTSSAAPSDSSGAVAIGAAEGTTEAAPSELATTAVDQPAGPAGWLWAVVGILAVGTAAAALIVRQRRQHAGEE